MNENVLEYFHDQVKHNAIIVDSVKFLAKSKKDDVAKDATYLLSILRDEVDMCILSFSSSSSPSFLHFAFIIINNGVFLINERCRTCGR